MTFTPQTFSSNAVLAASDLNTMDGNIDEVRANHKGPAAPASPSAGTEWVEDDNPSATLWSRHIYDGTDWIKLGEINATSNAYTHFSANGNFTSQLSAAAITAAALLMTGVSSFGSTVNLAGNHITGYRDSATVAQSASLVIVPDAELATTSIWEVVAHSTVADTARIMALGSFDGSGSPDITTVLSNTNMIAGYTANSGFWVRNLNASSPIIRAAALRRY